MKIIWGLVTYLFFALLFGIPKIGLDSEDKDYMCGNILGIIGCTVIVILYSLLEYGQIM